MEGLENYYQSMLAVSIQLYFDVAFTVIIAITDPTFEQVKRFQQLFLCIFIAIFDIEITIQPFLQSFYPAKTLIDNPDEPSLNAIEAVHSHLEPFESFLIILQFFLSVKKALFYELYVSLLYLLSAYFSL